MRRTKPSSIVTRMRGAIIGVVLCGLFMPSAIAQGAPATPGEDLPFRNRDLPLAERVHDLIGRMTLEEKASQAVMRCAAVPRLGIPAYDWWSECLHGVARAGKATAFPQAIGLASTWDTDLMFRIGTAISDEARAKHVHGKDSGRYAGLTFWTPTINMARDPRWGRTEETYGEDPHLTARLAIPFIRGLQGSDPRYLKVAACVKHFAAHNEEEGRFSNLRTVPEALLRTYYFRAFEDCITEAGVEQIMSAYSGLNGFPCSANRWLLTDVLRNSWHFRGTVVTDVGAPFDLMDQHKIVKTLPEAAAASLTAGADILSQDSDAWGAYVVSAVKAGQLDAAVLDHAIEHSLTTRFRLGLFDPPESCPWSKIPAEVVGNAAHRALALEAARKSAVLLRNAEVGSGATATRLLPLSRTEVATIAVLGPNAHHARLGAYSGTPANPPVTPVDGIRAAAGATVRIVDRRWAKTTGAGVPDSRSTTDRDADLALAATANGVVLVMGLNPEIEDEDRDRKSLGLPADQELFVRDVVAANPRTVLVLMNGGPLSADWAAAHVPAILEIWYPGEAGGTALGEILFGDVNPSGHLPVTVYRADAPLPLMSDYSLARRTHQFAEPSTVLFPFGSGLGYARITCKQTGLLTPTHEDASGTTVLVPEGGQLRLGVTVKNRDGRSGDEVVRVFSGPVQQLEIAEAGSGPLPRAALPTPLRKLVGFARVAVPAHGEARVEIPIRLIDLPSDPGLAPRTISWTTNLSVDLPRESPEATTSVPISWKQ